MNSTMPIDHAYFCQPRPAEDEIRTETFSTPRYDKDGVTFIGTATVHRCIECGEQTVRG